MAVGYTRGVVFVHSAPRALCPHVQWMLEDVLKTEVHLEWGVQKATPGVLRTEYSWVHWYWGAASFGNAWLG